MTFEVVIENLRAAARTLRTTTDPMAGYELDVTDIGAADMGHIELAAWLGAVEEQCDRGGQALRDGAVELATTLELAADDFERTDQGVAGLFGPPSPGSPWQPFPGLPLPAPTSEPAP